MRLMTRLCSLVALLLTAPTALWAQATGQITGIVTDASGAVLPGVTVEATNTGTGARAHGGDAAPTASTRCRCCSPASTTSRPRWPASASRCRRACA